MLAGAAGASLAREKRRERQDSLTEGPAPKPSAVTPTRALRLNGIPGRIQAILERQDQAIIYGPPGTGKTYWARQTALDVAAIGVFGRPFAELAPGERDAVEGTAPRHLRGSSASATVNCMLCCLACIAPTLA